MKSEHSVLSRIPWWGWKGSSCKVQATVSLLSLLKNGSIIAYIRSLDTRNFHYKCEQTWPTTTRSWSKRERERDIYCSEEFSAAREQIFTEYPIKCTQIRHKSVPTTLTYASSPSWRITLLDYYLSVLGYFFFSWHQNSFWVLACSTIIFHVSISTAILFQFWIFILPISALTSPSSLNQSLVLQLVSTLLLFSPLSLCIGYLISFCFMFKFNLRDMRQPPTTKQFFVPKNNRNCITKYRYSPYFDRQTVRYLK